MTGPAEIEVRGGSGGTAAELEDLERASGLLVGAAAGLGRIGVDIVRVSVDPVLGLPSVLSPLTATAAWHALIAAVAGPDGLVVVATRLGALGSALASVTDLYRSVDRAVAAALRGQQIVVGRLVGATIGAVLLPVPPAARLPLAIVGTGALAGWAAGPDPGDRAPDRNPPPSGALRLAGELLLTLLARGGPLTEHAAGAAPSVVGAALGLPAPPTTVPQLARAVIPWAARSSGIAGAPRTGAPWLLDAPRVHVRPGPRAPVAAPRGLADLLARVPRSSAERPRVRVDRIDGPAGRAWIVAVPGTTSWGPAPGTDPFDLTGDVTLMAGVRSAGAAATAAALQAAGARPGEPVMLVGHSQGGMVAAALAADPRFRARFAVSHVVTAGSPIAHVPVPDGVRVLALENSDDLVPRLDGKASPDRPSWITVHGPAAGLAGDAHTLRTYGGTAAAADASRHPSLQDWRASLTAFGFAGDGGSGVRTGESVVVDVHREVR